MELYSISRRFLGSNGVLSVQNVQCISDIFADNFIGGTDFIDVLFDRKM